MKPPSPIITLRMRQPARKHARADHKCDVVTSAKQVRAMRLANKQKGIEQRLRDRVLSLESELRDKSSALNKRPRDEAYGQSSMASSNEMGKLIGANNSKIEDMRTQLHRAKLSNAISGNTYRRVVEGKSDQRR